MFLSEDFAIVFFDDFFIVSSISSMLICQRLLGFEHLFLRSERVVFFLFYNTRLYKHSLSGRGRQEELYIRSPQADCKFHLC